MTMRLSTGLAKFLVEGGCLKQALGGGKIKIYSGSQPSSADDAPTGTLLVTITDASGAHTSETQATGSVQLTGGASGSVDDVTVAGNSILDAAVAFDTDLNTTATNLAAAINSSMKNLDYEASASTDTVTLTAKRGRGAGDNSRAIVSSTTTITSTDVNFASGVWAVNGLKFEDATSNALAIRTGQTWSGVAGADGTAGWFRFEGPVADSGAADTSEIEIRMDGTVQTSGGQLNMTSTTMSISATQTVTSFAPSMPTS